MTFPQLSDPSGVAAGADRITTLPFTVILDPHGRIVVRHPGAFTTEQLEYLLANEVNLRGSPNPTPAGPGS